MDSSGSVRCRRQPTESVEREDCSPSLESVHAISVCSAWLMSISHALTDLSDQSDSIAGEAAPDFLLTTMKGPIAKKIRKNSSRRWHQWCLNFRCNLQVCCKSSLPKCERKSLPQFLYVLWFTVSKTEIVYFPKKGIKWIHSDSHFSLSEVTCRLSRYEDWGPLGLCVTDSIRWAEISRDWKTVFFFFSCTLLFYKDSI